jgi:hypothetical protein
MADTGAEPGVTGRARAGFSGEKDEGQSSRHGLGAALELTMHAAVKRDAMDPQFMANLSKLGQVSIHDAGKFMRTVSTATMTAASAHKGGVQVYGAFLLAAKRQALAWTRWRRRTMLESRGAVCRLSILSHSPGPLTACQPAPAQRTLNARRDEYTSTSAAPPPEHLTAPLLISLLDRLKTLPPGTEPSKVYGEYGMDANTMSEIRRWVNSPSVGEDEVRVEDGNRIVEMKVSPADAEQRWEEVNITRQSLTRAGDLGGFREWKTGRLKASTNLTSFMSMASHWSVHRPRPCPYPGQARPTPVSSHITGWTSFKARFAPFPYLCTSPPRAPSHCRNRVDASPTICMSRQILLLLRLCSRGIPQQALPLQLPCPVVLVLQIIISPSNRCRYCPPAQRLVAPMEDVKSLQLTSYRIAMPAITAGKTRVKRTTLRVARFVNLKFWYTFSLCECVKTASQMTSLEPP